MNSNSSNLDRILPPSIEGSSAVDSNEGRTAFDALAGEMRAIPEENVVRATTDSRAVVIHSLATVPTLRTVLADASSELRRWDPSTIDRFVQCAHALSHAQTRFLAGQAQNTQLFNDTLTESQRVLNVAIGDLVSMGNRGIVDRDRVERIKAAGTAREVLPERLRACAQLVREARAVAPDRVVVSERELAYIEQIADRMQAALVSRSKSMTESQRNRRDRDRIFTLFYRTYQQIRRAVDYVRFFEGDADEVFPSIFLRGRKKDEGEGDSDEQIEDGAEENKPTDRKPGEDPPVEPRSLERKTGEGEERGVPQNDPF